MVQMLEQVNALASNRLQSLFFFLFLFFKGLQKAAVKCDDKHTSRSCSCTQTSTLTSVQLKQANGVKPAELWRILTPPTGVWLFKGTRTNVTKTESPQQRD